MTKPKMTDYYKMLFPEVAKTIGPLHDTVTGLAQQVSSIKKNLDIEQALLSQLGATMQQMKDKPLDFEPSGEMEDVDILKGFKEKAVSLASKIQAGELTVNSLKSALEKKSSELDAATQTLKNKLTVVIRQNRPIADKNVNLLLESAFDEQAAFLDAFNRIYQDYGQALFISDETLVPGVLNAADVEELKMRIRQFEMQQAVISRTE